MTVTPVNQPPVATAQSLSVIHDTAQVIVLSGTDAETPAEPADLHDHHAADARHAGGRAPAAPNAFTYTPAAGYLGADSFSFTVTDTGNPPGNLGEREDQRAGDGVAGGGGSGAGRRAGQLHDARECAAERAGGAGRAGEATPTAPAIR